MDFSLQKTSKIGPNSCERESSIQATASPPFTKGICMCFSLCCEVVSTLQFGALGGLRGGAGVKHGVVGVWCGMYRQEYC